MSLPQANIWASRGGQCIRKHGSIVEYNTCCCPGKRQVNRQEVNPKGFICTPLCLMYVPGLICLSKAKGDPRVTQNRMISLPTPPTYHRPKWQRLFCVPSLTAWEPQPCFPERSHRVVWEQLLLTSDSRAGWLDEAELIKRPYSTGYHEYVRSGPTSQGGPLRALPRTLAGTIAKEPFSCCLCLSRLQGDAAFTL